MGPEFSSEQKKLYQAYILSDYEDEMSLQHEVVSTLNRSIYWSSIHQFLIWIRVVDEFMQK